LAFFLELSGAHFTLLQPDFAEIFLVLTQVELLLVDITSVLRVVASQCQITSLEVRLRLFIIKAAISSDVVRPGKQKIHVNLASIHRQGSTVWHREAEVAQGRE
jgi:hypothetical protein